MSPSRRPQVATLALVCVSLLGLGACSKSEQSTAPPPLTTGGIDLTVQGLPGGVSAAIQISGSGGYSYAVTSSETITGLAPGSYNLASTMVSSGDWEYTPTAPSQNIMIGAGAPRPTSVNYTGTITRGSLAVSLTGVPAGGSGAVLVTGPNQYSQSVTQTDTLSSLVPGNYVVTAAVINEGGTEYAPFPASEGFDIVAGGMGGSFITYGERTGASLDLYVVGFEISQATQNDSLSVPLIRDRDAHLRVYGIANEVNAAVPDLRVDYFINGQLQQSETLSRNGINTPTAKAPLDLSSTWNTVVPAGLIQPNLEVRFEIDPQNNLLEGFETNNRYPLDGSSRAVNVVSRNPLPLRLVPVYQSSTGLTGDVNGSNQGDYISLASKLLPFPNIDVDVRATYTTATAALESDDGNGSWTTVLQELLALRNTTDSSSRYYYGVVQTTYTSGVAGLGYVPFSKSQGYNVAMGWDRANSRAGVAAHEIGHNLGRPHSPCGGAANPDPEYPYAGASIGVRGMDLSVPEIKDPASYTDLMGYCNPQWISDYSYTQILDFMGAPTKALSTASTSCILVWGRVHDGELILEPAFLVQARPHLPSRRGDYRVDARDVSGGRLFDLSFDLPPVADHPNGQEGAFAWTVPVTARQASALYELEARGPQSRAVQRSRNQDIGGPARRAPYFLERVSSNELHLEWDASVHPVVIVRDPATREVLSFARGGSMKVRSRLSEVQLELSDGARTEVQRATLR
jgi:Metallo-peptidase family M12B Reprolysin-like